MLLVKSYEDFLNMLHDRYGSSERIVCLLFLDPLNNDEIGGYISQRFEYFHERSGKYVDFFCVGYSKSNHMRKFNTKDYVEFINQLESITTWHYNGGTNLLILRYSSYNLQFDSVYDLNLTRMLIDGLIKDYRFFLEEIIRHLRFGIADYIEEENVKAQSKSLWENFSDFFPNYVRGIIHQIQNIAKINKYFSPHDIEIKHRY